MSNMPRPESPRTDAPRPGPARPPFPHQIARTLYGSAFDASEREEVEHSMWDFRKLNQKDQLFIVGHLLYLNLQAEAGTQRALAGVRELLHHIAGATYAIADEVSRPRLEAEYEAELAAEAADSADAAGLQTELEPEGVGPEAYGLPNLSDVAATELHPVIPRDSGAVAGAVLPQRPVQVTTVEDLTHGEAGSAGSDGETNPPARSSRGKGRGRRTAGPDNTEGENHAG